ncbi:protein of unknown function [Candidatus Methylocalor cossyra]|uniref:Uncharacterized protein n=1 Tax=Candidatus Methylocalor cossyra TaxID=3108543 RepID=A0ABM9NFF5_9GAMM
MLHFNEKQLREIQLNASMFFRGCECPRTFSERDEGEGIQDLGRTRLVGYSGSFGSEACVPFLCNRAFSRTEED